nr:MAG TPA_asm: hypothetical protein [Caudoviricetes sp.]
MKKLSEKKFYEKSRKRGSQRNQQGVFKPSEQFNKKGGVLSTINTQKANSFNTPKSGWRKSTM